MNTSNGLGHRGSGSVSMCVVHRDTGGRDVPPDVGGEIRTDRRR